MYFVSPGILIARCDNEWKYEGQRMEDIKVLLKMAASYKRITPLQLHFLVWYI